MVFTKAVKRIGDALNKVPNVWNLLSDAVRGITDQDLLAFNESGGTFCVAIRHDDVAKYGKIICMERCLIYVTRELNRITLVDEDGDRDNDKIEDC